MLAEQRAKDLINGRVKEGWHLFRYAENQPEYETLSALRNTDKHITEIKWKLTWRERLRLLLTGTLWHYIKNKDKLQPTKLSVDRIEEW